jgi:hypothetical protein
MLYVPRAGVPSPIEGGSTWRLLSHLGQFISDLGQASRESNAVKAAVRCLHAAARFVSIFPGTRAGVFAVAAEALEINMHAATELSAQVKQLREELAPLREIQCSLAETLPKVQAAAQAYLRAKARDEDIEVIRPKLDAYRGAVHNLLLPFLNPNHLVPLLDEGLLGNGIDLDAEQNGMAMALHHLATHTPSKGVGRPMRPGEATKAIAREMGFEDAEMLSNAMKKASKFEAERRSKKKDDAAETAVFTALAFRDAYIAANKEAGAYDLPASGRKSLSLDLARSNRRRRDKQRRTEKRKKF